MSGDFPIRDPEQIRRACSEKLAHVEVSDHFRAILGCLLGEDWTTPRLVEMAVTPDGALLGRCDGDAAFSGLPRCLCRPGQEPPRRRPGRRTRRGRDRLPRGESRRTQKTALVVPSGGKRRRRRQRTSTG